MFRKTLVTLTALIALSTAAAAQSPTPAAGPMCGDRGALVSLLKQQFAEEQEEVSLQSDQALVEAIEEHVGGVAALRHRGHRRRGSRPMTADLPQTASIYGLDGAGRPWDERGSDTCNDDAGDD